MHILITGGSGVIGKSLTALLVNDGHEVAWLSRQKQSSIKTFLWNVDAMQLDDAGVLWADVIIHLAGANIGEGRWTTKRKKDIFKSRVNSTKLLSQAIKRNNKYLHCFISASAIGYYGNANADIILNEETPSGDDFLSNVCVKWEQAVQTIQLQSIRVVVLRTGVVISKNSGLLKQLLLPAKLGLATILGNGLNYIPWIHINDLCAMYLFAINSTFVKGVYNAVAPDFVTQKQFVTKICKEIKRPIFLPSIPKFIIKILIGEMSMIILNGNKISNDKILNTGFLYRWSKLDNALHYEIKCNEVF